VHCIKNTSNTAHSRFIDQKQALAFKNTARAAIKNIANALTVVFVATLLSSCASRRMPEQTPAPSTVPAPAPVFTPQPMPAPAPPAASASRLPMVASWADYRRRAAQMIVAANPGASFVGPQPAQWSGIATVTVILNADGSVRAMDLMRGSRITPEVNDLALTAARRAANYGPVSNLPQPWQFNETFLYNDNNKFQLVTIVEGR
jgi:hypothetical protein